MQDAYTKYMIKLFSQDKVEIKLPMFIRLMPKLKNKDRKWYQFWKPRKIDNPDYIGNNTEIEFKIKRGQ